MDLGYYDAFQNPKIIYQVFQVTPSFHYDKEGMFTNNATYIIPAGDKYLLGYLNSPVGWFMIQRFCSPIQNGYQLMAAYFEKTLVFPASEKQKTPIIKLVQTILVDPDSPSVPRLEAEINHLVYALYKLTPDELKLIENPKSLERIG